jgi:Fungal specific transcription factor domain
MIQCSLEKPACRTCIKSGRTCAGYQRETIFLLDHRSKGDGPRGYRKPATDASYVRRAAPKKKTEPASPPPGSPSSKSLTRYLQPNSITGTLSPSTHSAYRQQLLNAFLTSARFRLPQSSQRESAHNPIASFLILLPTLSDVSPALETSFLALCTATLGRADSSQALVHESLKFYTQGLWELQRALWDPKSMYTDGTLSSCMLLVAYEVIECPGENITGWVNHMKGCSKLFELRGPKAYNSVFSHMLFSSFRILEVGLIKVNPWCHNRCAHILSL